MKVNSSYENQSGNVIVIIFIAIALFGALTFAFNQSSRTSSGFISDSSTDAHANKIIQILEENSMAVRRMRLKNCIPNFISYEGAGGGFNYSPVTDIKDKCKLFHENGGGLKYTKPPTNSLDEDFSSETGYGHVVYARNNMIQGASIEGDITHAAHVIIPFVKDDVCIAINKKLFDSDIIPEDTNGGMGLFSHRAGLDFSAGGVVHL